MKIQVISFCLGIVLLLLIGACKATKQQATTPTIILVEGGSFIMGTDKGKEWDRPPHEVQINSFYIDQYEVTNADYCAFLNQHGNRKEGGTLWLDIESTDCPIEKIEGKFVPKEGLARHPVVEVTWYGANAYAQKMGKRLPTEAEWEYAARGGNKSKQFKFSGAGNPLEIGWFISNTKGAKPIGTKKPNELGIYDMSGNAYEWCADWYDRLYYAKSPKDNPPGAEKQEDEAFKVIRGGSWLSTPDLLRCTRRNNYNPEFSDYVTGFRCVKDIY